MGKYLNFVLFCPLISHPFSSLVKPSDIRGKGSTHSALHGNQPLMGQSGGEDREWIWSDRYIHVTGAENELNFSRYYLFCQT